MAISEGAGPHQAWISVNGVLLPLEKGTAQLAQTKKSGTFSGTVPLNYPGAAETLANLGDNEATVLVMTRGATAPLMSGEIDNTDFNIIDGCIEISGRDASAKLHDKKTAEKWVNKKPNEIIQDLAGRVGLNAQFDQTSSLKMQRLMKDDHTKLTDNISFAMVVHKLCELMGARWHVKESTLFITSGDAQGAGYSISYYLDGFGEIVSDATALTIKRNVQSGKPIKVSVKSWHSREEKVFEGKHEIGGNGTAKEYVYHLPNLMQDHVDAHAKSKAKDHKRHEICVNATCVGDPSIDITGPLQLSGPYFAGSYTMDSIEHEFGNDGHTMSITAKGPKGGGGGS